jgi:hypothetical protein
MKMDWMDSILIRIASRPLEWLFAFVAGFMGYFAPVKNVFHLVVCAFILDSFFGIWHSLKIEKRAFSREKFFNSFFGRLFLVTAVLMLMYAGDIELNLGTEKMFFILAYIVVSLLLVNILKHGGEIFDWKAVAGVIHFIQSRLAKLFGIDVSQIKDFTENEKTDRE